ncbi:MAG: hypothetical protein ACOX42_09525 [Clostridia bacterium]|jgi:hypothetical protein|nr:hypothetical protein [Clostridiales bacterium]
MENRRDLENVREQLETIKNNSRNIFEGIVAINLIMVDDNNGKSKDANLSAQIARLGEKYDEMSSVIEETEEMLNTRQP